MATYCDAACEESGSICDFCKHYHDDLEGEKGFAGEGLCLAKNIRVDATDSCEDDFYCFLIDKK